MKKCETCEACGGWVMEDEKVELIIGHWDQADPQMQRRIMASFAAQGYALREENAKLQAVLETALADLEHCLSRGAIRRSLEAAIAKAKSSKVMSHTPVN